MAQVIGHFLLGLGGDAAQRLVGRGGGNGAPEGLHEGSEIELPRNIVWAKSRLGRARPAGRLR
jgi:hypothetical protein